MNPRYLSAAFLVLAFPLAACSHARPFTWVDEVPDTGGAPEYRIAARDVISVRVWNQESMTTSRARVREDGKISLPFLKDVQAAGMTPNELSARLQTDLESYFVSPVVTITLDEPAAMIIAVLGEVVRPGTYELRAGAAVLQAIATSGGLTEFASKDGIYVLRDGQPGGAASAPRIRFRYQDLTAGTGKGAHFLLRTGDVVLVE